MGGSLETAMVELGEKLHGWLERVVLLLPNLAVAILILLVTWGMGRLLAALTRRGLRRISHSPLSNLAARLVKLGVYVAGFVVALSVLQLDKAATSLLAGAGIVALVVGFAFQDLSANFIAGVILAVRRPFRPGHVIESNELMGVVKDLSLRSTRIQTFAGQSVFIPNRKLFEEPLTNYSDLGRRRVDLGVGVSYGEDLARVKEVTVAALEALERVPDTEVELFFGAFADSAVTFEVRFWIPFERQTDFLGARSEAVMAIHRAYAEAGITIPFPIRTLDFGIKGGRTLAEVLPGQAPGRVG